MKNSGIPLSGFSPKIQAQISAALAGQRGIVTCHHLAADVEAAQGKQTIRQKQGPALNKTEAAFLDELRAVHPPRETLVQAVTLAIANGCRYTPDFFQPPAAKERARAFEVKGFMRDDAAVKLKVAARQFPWIRFFLVSRKGRASRWQVQEVLP